MNKQNIYAKDGSIAGYIQETHNGWFAFRRMDSNTALRPMAFSAVNFVLGKA